MNPLVLVLLLLGAGGIVYLNSKGKVGVFAGQPVRFVFASGSSEQNASRLRAVFDNVRDLGGGVYEVVPNRSGDILVPEGATVAGNEVHLS